MKSLRKILAPLVFTICYMHTLLAQTDFEGILTTRVTMAGVDMSVITEKVDYSRGDLGNQISNLYKSLPAGDLSRLQRLMETNPMMGLALVMTPPKATLYVKDNVVFAKTKGLGYEIQHYHNTASDEAFLYTTSLLNPADEVTAAYKPSDGYAALFSGDKLITTDKFNVVRSTNTATVAGYTCHISTYTPKSLPVNSSAVMGMPSLDVHKLVVYASTNLPKGINFSHPYYLPESHGIMRIDIYLEASDEPTMQYEMVDVKKTSIQQGQLIPKKSSPLYTLTDSSYGMKVLGIMMGGMSVMGADQDLVDDDTDY